MNTKNNARWRSSERNIIGAAIDLMREKEGELPTVKAICERAQVNRSTFYAHFADAVDLIRQHGESLQRDRRERIAAESGAWHAAKISRQLLEHIRDNQDFYRVALPNYRSFLSDRSYVKNYGGLFAPAYEHLGIEDEDERQLFRTFIDSGFQSVLSEWVEGGCTLDIASVGHVLEICLSLMGLEDPHPDQEG
ncbi:TetR/AcrR family transcriptional regulator [Coriobacteriales bacterium OH1046]|nr:TetR/AcrR family transcriptional regulator [Coriobacteriales bacterium OH1046]